MTEPHAGSITQESGSPLCSLRGPGGGVALPPVSSFCGRLVPMSKEVLSLRSKGNGAQTPVPEVTGATEMGVPRCEAHIPALPSCCGAGAGASGHWGQARA